MCESNDCKCESEKVAGEKGCRCGGHSHFIDPCLLLLIAQTPSHGYDLVERLGRYGINEVDPTKAYRHLRHLEAEGFLESAWAAETPGPARREYRITKEGLDFLQTWPLVIQKSIDAYGAFVEDLKNLNK
ncbi:MAG: PadR family transcriptional regulator [Spirochaetes bacterium]|nr:PadR family transcriptional regulator [Spirochaetota bacterium]